MHTLFKFNLATFESEYVDTAQKMQYAALLHKINNSVSVSGYYSSVGMSFSNRRGGRFKELNFNPQDVNDYIMQYSQTPPMAGKIGTSNDVPVHCTTTLRTQSWRIRTRRSSPACWRPRPSQSISQVTRRVAPHVTRIVFHTDWVLRLRTQVRAELCSASGNANHVTLTLRSRVRCLRVRNRRPALPGAHGYHGSVPPTNTIQQQEPYS